MGAKKAFTLIDQMEDFIFDLRILPTETEFLRKSLRQLRLEIVDELSDKNEVILEKEKTEPVKFAIVEEKLNEVEVPETLELKSPSLTVEKKEEIPEKEEDPFVVIDPRVEEIEKATSFQDFLTRVERNYRISGRRLAKVLHINPATYSSWKTGKSIPRDSSRFTLSAYLSGALAIPIEVCNRHFTNI